MVGTRKRAEAQAAKDLRDSQLRYLDDLAVAMTQVLADVAATTRDLRQGRKGSRKAKLGRRLQWLKILADEGRFVAITV